ncbi:MAG TPA: HEAT repeat domain-containing protein [Jatrophihabitans sp.]|jgi:hypothetical protein
MNVKDGWAEASLRVVGTALRRLDLPTELSDLGSLNDEGTVLVFNLTNQARRAALQDLLGRVATFLHSHRAALKTIGQRRQRPDRGVLCEVGAPWQVLDLRPWQQTDEHPLGRLAYGGHIERTQPMTWTPAQILSTLESPATDRRPVLREIADGASVYAVIETLGMTEVPFTRRLLFDVLGEIRSPQSVQSIVLGLSDLNESVRIAAADALGKIFGYTNTPPTDDLRSIALGAVVSLWTTEQSPAVLSTLAQTMALLGDPAVKPLLQGALGATDRRVRRQAEWGLAHLARAASGS